MYIIGLDALSASFSMAILNKDGKLCKCIRRPTSVQNLIEIVSSVNGHEEPISSLL